MAHRYQVDFYAWVGEHGHTGENFNSLQTAFESAKEFLAQEKKSGAIKEYGYIGVDGGASNDFAIVFMTEEYLRNASGGDFKNEFAYENWVDVAKKVLKTGKPQKGNYAKEMAKGGITPQKARQILHDGTVHGRPITEQQRKFFGARASGYPEKHEKGGKVTGELNGRKITKLSYPSRFGHVWGKTPMALHLDNGAMLIPSSDYEQNDAGAWLLGSDKTFGVLRGGESKEKIQKLIKDASKYLVGKKIVEVDNLSKEELSRLNWYNNSMVITLNNGSSLFVSKDDEGTDGGALFLVKGEDWIAISEKQPKIAKKGKGGETAPATTSGISWIITGTYI